MRNYREERGGRLGFRISRIFRMNACLLDKKLAVLGLSVGQVPYINTTLEQEGQTQDDLAARVCVNRAATARTLKTMEKMGLITRKENPENRRQKLVYPTDKSRAVHGDLLAILDEYNELMFRDFSSDDKTTLIQLLDRVVNNIQDELDAYEDTNDNC